MSNPPTTAVDDGMKPPEAGTQLMAGTEFAVEKRRERERDNRKINGEKEGNMVSLREDN